MDFKKPDYQKLINYGILLLIGVYFLRDVLELDFRIPILEGQANQEETAGSPAGAGGAAAQEELDDIGLDEEPEEDLVTKYKAINIAGNSITTKTAVM